jgi:hypothetical protein
MKVKRNIPTEPMVTVKLEIDEAEAIVAGLSGKKGLATEEKIASTYEVLKLELAKELDIDLNPGLFDDAEVNQPTAQQTIQAIQG